jgi:hypothetical protein
MTSKKEPKKYDFETYFLISQEDLYKIDSMLGALNLAITEILERRPVKERRWAETPAQWDFDEHINSVIRWNTGVTEP